MCYMMTAPFTDKDPECTVLFAHWPTFTWNTWCLILCPFTKQLNILLRYFVKKKWRQTLSTLCYFTAEQASCSKHNTVLYTTYCTLYLSSLSSCCPRNLAICKSEKCPISFSILLLCNKEKLKKGKYWSYIKDLLLRAESAVCIKCIVWQKHKGSHQAPISQKSRRYIANQHVEC